MSTPTVTLDDGRVVCLGRREPADIQDAVRFRVITNQDGSKRYIAQLAAHYDTSRDVEAPSPTVDYSAKAMASISLVYLNDQLGDCVIASSKHRVGVWTGNEIGTPALATNAEVQNEYQGICGRGDNGCDISTVLDYHRTHGMLFSGVLHKIDDYVAVDWTNKNLVMVAIEEFGAGLNIGFNLPGSWENSNTWDVSNAGRVVGGHDVTAVGRNETGVQLASWGRIYTMTWAAFCSKRWITECYVSLSPDWYNKGNLTPNGINVDTLRSDLAALKAGIIPDPFKPVPISWGE